MNFSRFQPKRSLKTRVTLFTLAIFVLSIWALTFFASRMLQGDMQHLLGEQQFSTVSVIAQNVNDRLADRLRSLEAMAAQIDANLLGHAAALQTRLEERPILSIMFNAGAFVTGIDGTAIASVPVSTGRIGISYLERDFIVTALKEGRSSIGRPVIGKQLKSALIVVAAPIRDRQGKVIGAMAGVTDLGQPNFLDQITRNSYGESGGYMLNAPKERLIITATDKTRIMQTLPPVGVNRMLDRYIQGFEGYGVSVNSRGVEELTSAKGIPVAGWFMGVVMPAADAFEPIYDMQRRMLLASLFLTLLAGLLTWWMLKRQLDPLIATADAMVDLSSKSQIPQPLPVSSQDEIGRLASGFNRLVGSWIQREGALRESEERYRTLIEWSPEPLAVHDGKTLLYVNSAAVRMFGAESEKELLGNAILDLIHPDSRDIVRERIKAGAAQGATLPMIEARFLRRDGTSVDVEVQDRQISFGGRTAIQVSVHDITERKQAEQALRSSEELLRESQQAAKIGSYINTFKTGMFASSAMLDEIFGITPDYPHTNEGWANLVHPDSRQSMQDASQASIGNRRPFDAEYRIIRPSDGIERWMHGLGQINYDDKGNAISLVGTVQDITERKLAETALRESEERYRTLIEWSPQALAVHQGKEILYVNPAAIKLFGAASEQDLVGKSIFDRVHPDFRENVRELLKNDGPQGKVFPIHQTKLLKFDGSTIDVESQSTLIVYGGVQARQIVLRDVTEQKRIAAQVAASESRMRAVFDAALDAVISMDSAGHITSWNGRAEAIFGWRSDEVVGLMLHETITPPQHRAALQEGLVRFLATGQGKMLNRRVQLVALRRNGEEFPVELSILTFKEDGAYHFTAFVADITERKIAEETQRIAATAFNSQQGMCITDADKMILRVNKAFTKITGYTVEEVVGKTPRLLSSGRHDAAFYALMWESITRTGQWHGEIWNRRKNGTLYPEMLNISCVRNEDGVATHYVGSFSDLSSAKAADEQIESLAFSDLLTGLPNRRMLIIALQQAMIAGEREKRQGALLLVDLDHFKNLNDALGHEQGDLLLLQFAKRLSASVREGETVSRLGGDEFVVLLTQLDTNPLEAAMHAETTAKKLLDALRQPYQVGGAEISCSASIGITLFGSQHEDTVEPLKRAELAMYEAKGHGRNTLRFFDPEMQAAVNSRVVMEAALREAIATSQFLLHYQAQVTEQGRITGAEALLRWTDPKRGMVSPTEFIPLAEESGLILAIGDWVMESACRQLAQWASQPVMAHLTLAVNVSARQFHQRDFVDQVLGTLERTGANPARLKLELTESLLISNVADVIAKMDALKGRGVGFSLDDFGTGYSSLTYLKRLPLDQLKIDQSFVRDILIDPDDAAIARTVVALAESLGLAVIAEGVETEAQRDFLASLGCRNYQGYLFSRPLPVAEFEALAQPGL